MRTLTRALFVVSAVFAACGTSSSTSGDQGTSPFLGTFSCAYNGTYRFTGSTTVEQNNFNESATISAGTATALSISGLVDGVVSGPCTTTLAVTNSTTATFSPTEQSCTFTKTDGSVQTNLRTGTLTLTSGGASLATSGTFTGKNSTGAAYSGTFTGTWTCTKS